MSSYQYTVDIDIDAKIANAKQLFKQMRGSQIKHKFRDISRSGGNITIICDESLDASEKTYLDNLLKVHIPNKTDTFKDEVFMPIILSTITNSGNYYTISSLIYQGTSNDDSIKRFEFYLDLDPSVSSFSLRIMDITNSSVLVEQTFSENTDKLYQLNLSTVPETKSVLEIQCKRNDGGNKKNIYIKAITMQKQ